MNTNAILGTSTATANPIPMSTSGQITSDFKTFLTLLTTQMKNQDPLNPMESTEFATQLATFSGVEQQVRTNEQLGSLLAQNGVSVLSQLSSWVGLEVLQDAPVYFEGHPVELFADPAPGADRARLTVHTSSGTLAQSMDVPVPVSSVTWGGVDGNDHPYEKDTYSFKLEQFRDGKVISSTAPQHFAVVSEARSDGAGGVGLRLEGGVTISAVAVKAVRARPL